MLSELTLTLTVTAIGSLLFGLAYLFVPDSLASLYGITLDPSSQYPRFFGSALLGFATVRWLTRKATSGPALRGVLVGSFAASLSRTRRRRHSGTQSRGQRLLEWVLRRHILLPSLGFGDFVFRTPPPR